MRGGRFHTLDQFVNACFEIGKDVINVSGRVDQVKIESAGHRVKLLNNAALVFHIAVIIVGLLQKVHTGFPIVETASIEHAGYEVVEASAQVKDLVWNQSKAEHIAYPFRVQATNQCTRNERIDVAVGEYDKAGPQGGDDLAFEAICEVSGIKETTRHIT
jgi:hypothetical protein